MIQLPSPSVDRRLNCGRCPLLRKLIMQAASGDPKTVSFDFTGETREDEIIFSNEDSQLVRTIS